MDKVNPIEKLNKIKEYWKPKIVGELNESYIKLTKLKGEFVWHYHDQEDEFFLVIKGNLLIKLRDRDATLREGEFIIIPKGEEHKPVANEEVSVMLIEPKSTVNTGNIKDERTLEKSDWI